MRNHMIMRRFWQIATVTCTVAVLLTSVAIAEQVGVWQLNGNLDNALPGKAPMSIAGAWSATYVASDINGSPATVLSFPKMDNTQALQMPNQAGANGAGTATNIWSIVLDVNFPELGGYAAFWQTDQNIAGSDGDFFVRNNNDGIGISGSYHGVITQGTWNRVAVAIRPDGGSYLLEKYINGALVGTTTSGTPLDGRHSVGAVLNLFTDEDGETAAGLVNSVAYYNTVLSPNEIGVLGGASAAGIPAVPEPSFGLLLLTGLPMLAGLRRRRG